MKQGMINEYLTIAAKADKAVETTVETMLFHNFDADPDDAHKFVWRKVYRKSEDFLFDLDNPPVQEDVKNIVTWPRISQLKFMEMSLKP